MSEDRIITIPPAVDEPAKKKKKTRWEKRAKKYSRENQATTLNTTSVSVAVPGGTTSRENLVHNMKILKEIIDDWRDVQDELMAVSYNKKYK